MVSVVVLMMTCVISDDMTHCELMMCGRSGIGGSSV